MARKSLGKQKFESNAGAAFVDLECFPEVPPDVRPRRVYFPKLSILDRETLRARGYDPMTLFELPRGGENEIAYLRAKAQAIEEGTVTADKLTVAALELQMKNNNMLSQKHMAVNVKLSAKLADVEGLLKSWGQSRHTLRGNSTVQAANVNLKSLKSREGKRPRGKGRPVKKELLKVASMLGDAEIVAEIKDNK